MEIAMTTTDLSDRHLAFCRQIGLDGIDINRDSLIPGLTENGYPDSNELGKLAARIQTFGMRMVCVNLPHPVAYMTGGSDGARALQNVERTVRCYADAGVSFTRVRVEPPVVLRTHKTKHRRGYSYSGFDLRRWQESGKRTPWLMDQEATVFWERGLRMYECLLKTAERSGIRLVMHPTDPPIEGAPFDGAGLTRLMEETDSPYSGLLYCVGSRAEKGGQELVRSEIEQFQRMNGKIFHIHLRNIRGSLDTKGRFEEVLLDDGELDLRRLLSCLAEHGYTGAVNPDHIPPLGDEAATGSENHRSLAYAVGHLRGLLAGIRPVGTSEAP